MNFAADVSRIARRMGVRAEEVVAEVIKELYGSTVKDTPVDTSRLQGNWQLTMNVPAAGNLERFGADGPAGEIQGGVGAPGLYYLTNNLPYAERIEMDGWSHTKAPQGMVRINARRVHHILAQEARRP